MSELTSYNSERIYWAVEQVEREAGDIDDLHLDDNLFYLKSEADKVIADKDTEIRRLRRALFIAHAIKAKFKWWWMSECKHNESCKLFPDTRKIKKFTNSAWVCSKSQEKCRAKAEEYK